MPKLLTLSDVIEKDGDWLEDIEVGQATLSRYAVGKGESVWICKACETHAPDARELGCTNEDCEHCYEVEEDSAYL